MRVLPELLVKLAPSLADTAPEVLAETLTILGFEAEILPGETFVLDVSITPNRGDAMSHLGLARELLAFKYKDRARKPKPLKLVATGATERLVEFKEKSFAFEPVDVASQYHVVLFENVTIGPSPLWLQRELKLLGIRPISNIVDVTNYLMELYGQPLHAFDADTLLGSTLSVREAATGEVVTTLDGTEHALPKGAIVIADREGLVDLAGIQGGANSEVRTTTTRVILQSAIFDTRRIRHTTNLLNHRTAASTRYERGVDSEISLAVLDEAIRILGSKEFNQAKATAAALIKSNEKPKDSIQIFAKRIDTLLGFHMPTSLQLSYLESIGCDIEIKESHSYTVTPPTWRFDLTYWQDIAEEIARFISLDEIPARRLPPLNEKKTNDRSQIEWAEGIKDRLVELNLSEVMTYSFVSKEDLDNFSLPMTGELANPLNPNLKFLRPSLMPNLTKTIAMNNAFDPIMVFEIGHVFTSAGEDTRLGVALAGNTLPAQAWLAKFADLIGIDSGELRNSATILELDDKIRSQYKIRKNKTALIELPLNALQSARRIPVKSVVPTQVAPYRVLSKFPPVTRDVALILPSSLSAEKVRDMIKKFHDRIELVELFDEFASPKFGEGMKSLAFHIYYSHPDRTLTEKEIATIQTELERALAVTFTATIR